MACAHPENDPSLCSMCGEQPATWVFNDDKTACDECRAERLRAAVIETENDLSWPLSFANAA